MDKFIREYEIKESHLKDNIKEIEKVEDLKDEYKLNTFASFMLAIGEEIKKGRQFRIYEIKEKIAEKEVLFLNGKIVQEELSLEDKEKAEKKKIKVLNYEALLSEGKKKEIKEGSIKCLRSNFKRKSPKDN